MPGTWSTWGIDANADGTRSVWDPADAVPAAAAYDCALASQMRSVPGATYALMLAAYNAGPYAVLDAGGIPAIPETVRYVARVLASVPRFGTGTVGARVVAFAFSRLGTPYEWGGTGSDGRFDCSGLTQAAFAAAGVALPRTAQQQFDAGAPLAILQLEPGDLVFFGTDSENIHHVGIYVGYGQMIDAPHTGAVIRFDSIASRQFQGARRMSSSPPRQGR